VSLLNVLHLFEVVVIGFYRLIILFLFSFLSDLLDHFFDIRKGYFLVPDLVPVPWVIIRNPIALPLDVEGKPEPFDLLPIHSLRIQPHALVELLYPVVMGLTLDVGDFLLFLRDRIFELLDL